VAWRWLVLRLVPTEKPTVPLPLPGLPEVIVSQLALLVALQLQPACAVTATLPMPPPAPND
jgi:hypothetical protein